MSETHPRIRRRIELVHLGLEALRALAAGDVAAASEASGLAVTAWLAGPECVGTWRIRAAQVAAHPVAVGWVTAVVLDADRRAVVGKAGYHGPPDEAGMVEVGYAVDPAFRRRGYARAALEHLLARAAREPGVRTVRASIRPDNMPSRNLVLGYGFAEVGRQWDEEDGWETVYEVAAHRFLEVAARPPSGEVTPSEVAIHPPSQPGR
ncbi:GNAT family N-acetyltransferase [Georgenia ruanii]|uniref:GNAT family N-acetyltransferase n=1 Tax=Georgenia ruanii TaxID=348442 RepID=A0A7J9UVE3_9MICO|nr:GNAT family N-acetyltransferase [Georgenia ruanii]MPV87694.1 GNAT family N-acetyltransferase [Georgenia ruanii]